MSEAKKDARRAQYLFGLAYANISEFDLWEKAAQGYHSAQEMFQSDIPGS